MNHVHAAGKAEPPALVRRELDRGLGQCGQRPAQSEVGKYDPRCALAALLTIEDDPQRHALLYADQVRRIAALDQDLNLLYLVDKLSLLCLLGVEKELGQKANQHDPGS